jgi:hypothetical protein
MIHCGLHLASSWGASPPDPPEQVQGPGSLRMPSYGLARELPALISGMCFWPMGRETSRSAAVRRIDYVIQRGLVGLFLGGLPAPRPPPPGAGPSTAWLHPYSSLSWGYKIAEFTLSTILFCLNFSAKNGNKPARLYISPEGIHLSYMLVITRQTTMRVVFVDGAVP